MSVVHPWVTLMGVSATYGSWIVSSTSIVHENDNIAYKLQLSHSREISDIMILAWQGCCMVSASVYSNGSLKLHSSPCNCQRKRKANCIFVVYFQNYFNGRKGYSFDVCCLSPSEMSKTCIIINRHIASSNYRGANITFCFWLLFQNHQLRGQVLFLHSLDFGFLISLMWAAWSLFPFQRLFLIFSTAISILPEIWNFEPFFLPLK